MDDLLRQASDSFAEAKTLRELDLAKNKYLGKSGAVSELLSQLAKVPADQRKDFGRKVNLLKEEVHQAFLARESVLKKEEILAQLQSQAADLSLPGRSAYSGNIHPISQVITELVGIFSRLGFELASGPDIESDWYNFAALNIAADHPARDTHDTFYLKNGALLRTHTSPVQIRFMEGKSPPFRFISTGRTYRADYDATHTPMFHQLEAVSVDRDLNMSHLRWVIKRLLEEFFADSNIQMRMRPSFFPFTQPSAEVDIYIPEQGKWLEVMGCGMMHPKVLQNAGVDAKAYRGFALGLGVERFAMLKYGISDLRKFFASDLRWLKAFGFSCFNSKVL